MNKIFRLLALLLAVVLICAAAGNSLRSEGEDQGEGEDENVDEDKSIGEKDEGVALDAAVDELGQVVSELEETVRQRAKELAEEKAKSNPSRARVTELSEELKIHREAAGKLLSDNPETLAWIEEHSYFEDLSKGLPTPEHRLSGPNCMWRTNPALGDVNQDGYLDIAAKPRKGKWGIRCWLYDGKGGWIDSSEGLPAGFMAGGGLKFADINKDGNLDIIVGAHGMGIAAYFGDGEGKWTEASNGLKGLPVTADAMDVAVADFDEDGHLDIVFAGWHANTGIVVFAGDSKGNWKRMQTTGLPDAGHASAMISADFNNDGHMDIAGSIARVTSRQYDPVWLNDGKGNFINGSIGINILRNGGTWGVATGDLNGDGNLDLVFGGSLWPQLEMTQALQVYLGNGLGIWKQVEMEQGDTSYKGVAMADLDGDGNLDVVGFAGTSNLVVHHGDGRGGFELMKVKGIENLNLPSWGIAAGDIDGDGFADIIGGVGTEGGMGDIMNKQVGKPVYVGGYVKAWFSRPREILIKKRLKELDILIEKALES
ncbi:MAG: FG-GAP-like repeat-containing protein [Planctomycetota bacterium]